MPRGTKGHQKLPRGRPRHAKRTPRGGQRSARGGPGNAKGTQRDPRRGKACQGAVKNPKGMPGRGGKGVPREPKGAQGNPKGMPRYSKVSQGRSNGRPRGRRRQPRGGQAKSGQAQGQNEWFRILGNWPPDSAGAMFSQGSTMAGADWDAELRRGGRSSPP